MSGLRNISFFLKTVNMTVIVVVVVFTFLLIFFNVQTVSLIWLMVDDLVDINLVGSMNCVLIPNSVERNYS